MLLLSEGLLSDEECWEIFSKMKNLERLSHTVPLNYDMNALSFKAFERVLSRLRVLVLGRPINFESFTYGTVFRIQELWLLEEYWSLAATECWLSYCPKLRRLVLAMEVCPDDSDREKVSVICKLRDEGKLMQLSEVFFKIRRSLTPGITTEQVNLRTITSFLCFDKLEERGITVCVCRLKRDGSELAPLEREHCVPADPELLKQFRKFRGMQSKWDNYIFKEMHERRESRRREPYVAKMISRGCRV